MLLICTLARSVFPKTSPQEISTLSIMAIFAVPGTTLWLLNLRSVSKECLGLSLVVEIGYVDDFPALLRKIVHQDFSFLISVLSNDTELGMAVSQRSFRWILRSLGEYAPGPLLVGFYGTTVRSKVS